MSVFMTAFVARKTPPPTTLGTPVVRLRPEGYPPRR
jgi:hypothetical protein